MSETADTTEIDAWKLAEQHALEHEPEQQHRVRAQAQESNWPVGSAAQNQLLTFMARAIRANSAISVGTGSVLEALALAAGLEANGQITAVDSSARGIAAIRSQIAEANARHANTSEENGTAESAQHHITLRAVNTAPSIFLPRLNPASYDLIVVSGDKSNYLSTFQQASYLLKNRGIIIFTDMLGKSSPDASKAETMQSLIETVEADDNFTSALTPTGTGLFIAARV